MLISPNDHRSYRFIKLDNTLPVLLISDPDASKSAAALSVNVGHFNDPDDREGLAHFVEHMLFLGTEKYPKIGEFQEFINQHGGSNNAWTGTENTTYFFDIQHDNLAEALERFGQFFTAPLFNASAVDKERNAIESEYQLKIQDDVRRIYQVKKETSNPKHPFSKFSVGNTYTLADRDGRSIREDLLKFYKSHYSANLMTATLLGACSLEELDALAASAFSDISNLALPPNEPTEPLIDTSQKMHFIEIEPIKELRKLNLSFSFRHNKDDYKDKSLSFLAHLLGDESRGSLMSLLKNKHWINHLSAGGGLSGSNFREFIVSLELTELGLSHIDDIVAYVFSALALIHKEGIEPWRYNEMRQLRETAFHFKEPARPLDTVSHLVMNMQHYEQEDVLYGDYMMQGFDEKQILEILSYLTPENMCITLVAKGGNYDKKTHWYSTPFSTKPFTKQQLELWQQAKPSPELSLPLPNQYISNALHALVIEEPQTQIDKPNKIIEEAGLRLWHYQESEFHLPKGVIYIAIDSPFATSSVANIVKLHLCVEMLLDVVNEDAYPAEIAGLYYNIYTHQGGATLKLSGFSPKLPLLLTLIIDKFLQRRFDKTRFDNIKTQLTKGWRNALAEKPIARLYNSLLGLVQSNNPSYEALLEAIAPICCDDLPKFVMQFLSSIHLEVFVYGNWHKKHAIEIARQAQRSLQVKDQCYQETQRPMWLFDENRSIFYEKDCASNDSAVLAYYQSPSRTSQDVAFYSFAQHLLSAVFFNELRTKRQLGYMVGSSYRSLNRVPSLLFYVQSPLVGTEVLLEAIDDFLNGFFLVLLELNQEQWQSAKQGLLSKINEPDMNLRRRSQRFWSSISAKDDDFSQQARLSAEIEVMTRDQMVRFVIEKLKPARANRLILHSCSEAHRKQNLSKLNNLV